MFVSLGWAALLAILVVCVRTFVVQPFRIPTNAMLPTLHGRTQSPDGSVTIGDHILVDKLAYRVRDPRRGEIVVFRTDGLNVPRVSRGTYYVKRIVGLPGERVTIKPPLLFVNDQRVTEPQIFQVIQSREQGYVGFLLPQCHFTPQPILCEGQDTIMLGKDEYLALGDNQRASLDGRYWGPLPRSNIVGHVTWIYLPLERAGSLVGK